VNPGGSTSFRVVADGTAPLSYQWRRNGTAVAGATSAVYTLTNAQAAQAGNYDVVVTNAAGSVTSQAAALVLNEAVRIITQPLGLTVNPGAPAVLSVVAVGTAPLSYQWRLNGVALPVETGSSLSLASASALDAGRYDVVVSNVVGSVVSDGAQVTLNTPVSIVTQPASVMVNPGGATRFSVTASGTAPLTYQWRKNGTPLVGFTESSLNFLSAQSADAGVYDVVVTNVSGSLTSSSATMGFNVPVVITAQPAAVTLNPGLSATLSVVATGTSPLAYQWYRNGKAVAGANSDQCVLEDVVAADAGVYTVEVSNVAGSVTSDEAVVTVNMPVTIVTQPKSGSVSVGSGVTLRVVATGSAPLTYQWRQHGIDIADATASEYPIASAQVSDAGVYEVVVGNAVGSVTSSQAVLTVLEPPVIWVQPQPVTVLAGAAVSLNVLAGGSAPFSYQWRRDGVDIQGATSAAYKLPAAKALDSGSYEVVVGNSAGTVVSAPALVTVNVPVSITTQPADFSLNVGATAVFTVAATGTAPLAYQWSKNGIAVAGGTQASLEVASAQLGDAGSYEVLVSNVVGSVSSRAAVLAVHEPLGMTPPPAQVEVAAWEATTLQVTATGAGPFTYQWRKNGVPIKGATGSSYTIVQAKSKDAGVYDVVITSPAGSITSSGSTVTVTGIVPGQPVVLVHPGNSTVASYASASVSATVGSEGGFSYQWYLNGKPVTGAGASGTGSGGAPQTLTYTIPMTTDKNQGLYRLVATGASGVPVTSRPGAVLLTISFGETRLLLKGWSMDLSTFLDDTNQGTDNATGVQYGFVDLPQGVPKNDTLVVAASAVGTVSYTWHFRAVNGLITRIPSHTNLAASRLQLSATDVPKTKKGSYVLTIRTSNPDSARAVYFNVMTFVASAGAAEDTPLPLFLQSPESLVVPEGGVADFGVELDGLISAYSWWKRDLLDVSAAIPWARSAPWLTMDAVSQTDGGMYWVEATDYFGRTVVSDEAELNVLPVGD